MRGKELTLRSAAALRPMNGGAPKIWEVSSICTADEELAI